jgi:deazaflavin-dependent oxidoreductase (nitroreductase family)
MSLLSLMAQRVFIVVHGFFYRLSRGAIGGRLFGNPVLLLTTMGRRTGKKRTTPLLYLREGENWVIVASNGGAPKHPGWWFNLKSHPEATIQVMQQTIQVIGEDAPEEERKRLWPVLVSMYPSYDGYQRKTTRVIPLVILRPVELTTR